MLDHLWSFFRHRDSRTVGLIFSFNSIMFGNWVTRIPDMKADLGLSAADLGLAILGMPVGAILIMPFCGGLINKQGLGKATALSTILFLMTASLPVYGIDQFSLMAVLFIYGLCTAYMDITMNAAAAVTEKKRNHPIMSTCHGMWSLGAMVGSGIGSIFVGFGVDPKIHLTSIAVILFVVVLFLLPTLLRYSDEEAVEGHAFALPKKAVFGLAFLAFCTMFSEGVIADWSAVYMTEGLQSGPFYTGLAFSGYAMMMAIGRFSGDMLIPRLGNRRIVVFGASIAFIGISIALLVSSPILAIVGFSFVGLGLSCLVPVFFSASAKTPGMSSGAGIAAVATFSYSGFLVGPPLIGWIADATSLGLAMGVVGILCLTIALLSGRVRL
ncbi:MAG: MFS transporter [Cyclobacteriaceae bacterium]